jgi:Family of unknown function (DUF5677)
MDTLQKAVNKTLEEVPLTILSALLDEKLREQNIKLSKRRLGDLTRRLLQEKSGAIALGRRTDVLIEFTDEDADRFAAKANEFFEQLPDLVERLSDTAVVDILASLRRRWRKEAGLQRRDMNGFRKRLEERWGAGLEPLRMLATIARGFGADINRDVGSTGGGERPKTFNVLIKLHARACQVTDEIICLLGGGYADGAMARWRTLHEIAAVAYLIARDGEDLAERYVAHQVVESRKAARQYEQHRASLGLTPFGEAELLQIEKDYAALIAKYGEDFKNSQGWASKAVGKSNPSITHIQEAVHLDHLGPYYRMASHNVHANPKGVFFKLGLVGPSNAGFADPGHATALSLLQISSSLLHLNATMDSNITVKIMAILADEAGEQLLAAHEQLIKDDETGRLGESAATSSAS